MLCDCGRYRPFVSAQECQNCQDTYYARLFLRYATYAALAGGVVCLVSQIYKAVHP